MRVCLPTGRRHAQGPERRCPITLTPCALKSDKLTASVPCHAAAVSRFGNGGELYAISLAAPGQIVQAITAGLGDRSMSFAWPELNHDWYKPAWGASGGFEVRKARLAYDTWQLVAVSKDHRFLLHESVPALWALLRSDRFTTPLLKHWAPKLREELFRRGLLKRPDYFGPLNPAYLLGTDQGLDRLVGDGVRDGWLRIEAKAA